MDKNQSPLWLSVSNNNLVMARLPPKLLLRFGHWRHSFDPKLNVSEALNKALNEYLPHYPHIED